MDSIVKRHQIYTIDHACQIRRFGHLSDARMVETDHATRMALGLIPP